MCLHDLEPFAPAGGALRPFERLRRVAPSRCKRRPIPSEREEAPADKAAPDKPAPKKERADTIALVEKASAPREIATRTALIVIVLLSVIAGLVTYIVAGSSSPGGERQAPTASAVREDSESECLEAFDAGRELDFPRRHCWEPSAARGASIWMKRRRALAPGSRRSIHRRAMSNDWECEGSGASSVAGEDDAGVWLVRGPAEPTLSRWMKSHDGPRTWQEALRLARSLAERLAECETESLFPGAIGPRGLRVSDDLSVELRADGLVQSLVGANAASGASPGGERIAPLDRPRAGARRALGTTPRIATCSGWFCIVCFLASTRLPDAGFDWVSRSRPDVRRAPFSGRDREGSPARAPEPGACHARSRSGSSAPVRPEKSSTGSTSFLEPQRAGIGIRTSISQAGARGGSRTRLPECKSACAADPRRSWARRVRPWLVRLLASRRWARRRCGAAWRSSARRKQNPSAMRPRFAANRLSRQHDLGERLRRLSSATGRRVAPLGDGSFGQEPDVPVARDADRGAGRTRRRLSRGRRHPANARTRALRAAIGRRGSRSPDPAASSGA